MKQKGRQNELQAYAETKFDVTITLPLDIYPFECICIAAYDLMDDLYFYIYREGSGKSQSVRVAMKARGEDGNNLDCLVGRFQNELIRQSLRSATAKMNRDIRQHVIGRALASALPAENLSGSEK